MKYLKYVTTTYMTVIKKRMSVESIMEKEKKIGPVQSRQENAENNKAAMGIQMDTSRSKGGRSRRTWGRDSMASTVYIINR